MNTSWLLTLSALVCVLSIAQVPAGASPVPVAGPTPAATKPTAELSTSARQNQVAKIATGTEASFLIVFNPGPGTSFVLENQAVVLPIAGQLGDSEIPKDSVLVGTLKRISEQSGVFEFNKLVLGTRVYEVKITSEPLSGRLDQDPRAMQALMGRMQGTMLSLSAAQAQAMGRMQAQATQAAGVGMLGGLLGMVPGGELLSGLVGGVAQAGGGAGGVDVMGGEMAENLKKLEAMKNEIPIVLFAEITPLQRLKMNFQQAVDLSTPVATLSAPMKAQGILTLNPDQDSDSAETLAAPGAQPQQPLKPTTPVPPNVNP